MTDTVHIPADLVEVIDSASARLDNPSLLEGMTPETLVPLLAQIADVQRILKDVEGEARRLVAAQMDDDRQQFGGYMVVRSRRQTEEWDGARARSEAKSAIVRRLATDPMTGEVHGPLRRVAEDAVDLTFQLTSTAPKAKLAVTGLQGLGLSANEFRSYGYGEIQLSVTPVREEA